MQGRASDPGKTLRLTEPVAGATLVRPLLHSSSAKEELNNG
jgi:hypothetical protein